MIPIEQLRKRKLQALEVYVDFHLYFNDGTNDLNLLIDFISLLEKLNLLDWFIFFQDRFNELVFELLFYMSVIEDVYNADFKKLDQMFINLDEHTLYPYFLPFQLKVNAIVSANFAKDKF